MIRPVSFVMISKPNFEISKVDMLYKMIENPDGASGFQDMLAYILVS